MCESRFEALAISCAEAYWTFWSKVQLLFQDEYVRNQMQAKKQISE
jgi:hypothetical protein